MVFASLDRTHTLLKKEKSNIQTKTKWGGGEKNKQVSYRTFFGIRLMAPSHIQYGIFQSFVKWEPPIPFPFIVIIMTSQQLAFTNQDGTMTAGKPTDE